MHVKRVKVERMLIRTLALRFKSSPFGENRAECNLGLDLPEKLEFTFGAANFDEAATLAY